MWEEKGKGVEEKREREEIRMPSKKLGEKRNKERKGERK